MFPVYIVRHPIERALSVYKFEKKQDIDRPGPNQAKALNFNDYIVWRMSPDSGAILRNANTLFCAGVGRKDVDEKGYQKALYNLSNTYLVGIVNRFDESMNIFEKYLRKHFPLIDMSYVVQNINQSQDKSMQEKILEVESLLSDETKKILYDRNQMDLQLFQESNRLIKERLSGESF